MCLCVTLQYAPTDHVDKSAWPLSESYERCRDGKAENSSLGSKAAPERCNLERSKVGALIISIGFGGPFYHIYNKEAPKYYW